jgi:hypothetical protein
VAELPQVLESHLLRKVWKLVSFPGQRHRHSQVAGWQLQLSKWYSAIPFLISLAPVSGGAHRIHHWLPRQRPVPSHALTALGSYSVLALRGLSRGNFRTWIHVHLKGCNQPKRRRPAYVPHVTTNITLQNKPCRARCNGELGAATPS